MFNASHFERQNYNCADRCLVRECTSRVFAHKPCLLKANAVKRCFLDGDVWSSKNTTERKYHPCSKWDLFQYKDHLSRYSHSHNKDTTVVCSSCLNRIGIYALLRRRLNTPNLSKVSIQNVIGRRYCELSTSPDWVLKCFYCLKLLSVQHFVSLALLPGHLLNLAFGTFRFI